MTISVWLVYVWGVVSFVAIYYACLYLATMWEYEERLEAAKSMARYWEDISYELADAMQIAEREKES